MRPDSDCAFRGLCKRAGFNAPDGDHPAIGQPLIVAASQELAVEQNVDFSKMPWVEMFGNSDNAHDLSSLHSYLLSALHLCLRQ
jgi:hypothetical protein